MLFPNARQRQKPVEETNPVLPAAGPALDHPEASARQNLAPNTKWDKGGSTVETLLLSQTKVTWRGAGAALQQHGSLPSTPKRLS